MTLFETLHIGDHVFVGFDDFVDLTFVLRSGNLQSQRWDTQVQQIRCTLNER